jgi:hypothetical protein
MLAIGMHHAPLTVIIRVARRDTYGAAVRAIGEASRHHGCAAVESANPRRSLTPKLRYNHKDAIRGSNVAQHAITLSAAELLVTFSLRKCNVRP